MEIAEVFLGDYPVQLSALAAGLAREDAVAVMLRVHTGGVGVAGTFTRDVAETKARAAQQLAEQQEFPLRVTTEPEA